ncbi:hypothetical protein [Chryseobacterium indologenes]|uniref:ABC transporter permease n=1 Tax=Chryseobacterium indologenes TaxID=253 RepID=A0A0N1KR41_CHRID|nr:hypothetical protein [Chryseobacterium indologenes]KPE49218.1 hypothetical protein AOB46_21155 [Chryseobacterium indologenes]
MKKLFNHFKFRFNQSFRLLNLNPRASLPALLIFGLLIVVKLPKDYYYPVLFFLFLLLFHLERKDIPFLKKVFVKSWQWVITLEAVCIYSVLLSGNINYTIEEAGVTGYLMIVLLAAVPPKTKPWLSLKWDFIPNDLFEWRSFLRKNTWMFLIGYIAVVLSSYQPLLLILAGTFVLDLISHIYEPHESKEMLEMYFKKYSLKQKLRRNSLFFNFLLLPVYCTYLILNPFESIYLIYYFVFMNLYFLLIITRKYRQYTHKEKSSYYNMAVFIEYSICSLTVIPALFILNNHLKVATQNIRTYVGD